MNGRLERNVPGIGGRAGCRPEARSLALRRWGVEPDVRLHDPLARCAATSKAGEALTRLAPQLIAPAGLLADGAERVGCFEFPSAGRGKLRPHEHAAPGMLQQVLQGSLC